MRFTESQNLRFSDSRNLRFWESQNLRLGLSDSQILRFSESPILRISASQNLRIQLACTFHNQCPGTRTGSPWPALILSQDGAAASRNLFKYLPGPLTINEKECFTITINDNDCYCILTINGKSDSRYD